MVTKANAFVIIFCSNFIALKNELPVYYETKNDSNITVIVPKHFCSQPYLILSARQNDRVKEYKAVLDT